MNLGVDLTSLSESWAGMQYYASNFVQALSATSENPLTVLISAGQREELPVASSGDNHTINVRSIMGSRVLQEQLVLPVNLLFNGNRPDRLLVPAYFGPVLAPCPVDMIVYDFLYLRGDSGHSFKERLYWKGLYRAAFYRANRLYPCSRTIRDEMIRRMPWVEPKVGPVLYPGHRRYRRREKNSSEREVSKPFLLFVGTISPRKNVSELLEFYRKAPESLRENYDLRLAGQHGWGEPEPEDLDDAGDGIVWEGRVSDRRLEYLYDHASLLVLPSTGEGFGMPILEAFRHSLPVLLSPLDVFREVAGDAAFYLPSFDWRPEWNDVFQEALSDPAKRREKTTRGVRRSRNFSWATSAKRYLDDVRSTTKS